MAIWGVIPAAGYGTRMSSDVPKQHLLLHGLSLLHRSCRTLLDSTLVDNLVVVVSADDTGFIELPADIRSRVITTIGGATRSDSVAAGVKTVIEHTDRHTWTLVHDAARPLLSQRDLVHLISLVTQAGSAGGLLATPVADTLKRSTTASQVLETVNREGLWQAQTPQLFRSGALLDALNEATAAGVAVTDEASAMEYAGVQPQLVPAADPNFKVTCDADLQLANAWLAAQSRPLTQ